MRVAVRPGDRGRPGLPAPADRRLGLRRHRGLHLRRHARRPDRLPAAPLHHRPRPGADPAAAAPGRAAQPAAADHRDALEPARVDEDQRLADRRPADRRPARSTAPTRCTCSSSSRRTRPNGVTVDTITVQNEPQNRAPSGYPARTCRPGRRRRSSRISARCCAPRACSTQILAYDHNWSEHPNDIAVTPPDETADINDYPQKVLHSPAAQVGLRHRLPLLLRRPERDDHAARPVPGQGRSTSPSARAASPPTRRTPSPTPSSGTPAT